jgi:hypothetical protein
MAGNQHTTKQASLFAAIPLDGKKLSKTANTNYSAELVKPSAPKSTPNYDSPTTAAVQSVPPARAAD